FLWVYKKGPKEARKEDRRREKEKRCCRRENTERNQGLQRGEEPRSKKVLQKLILKREETIPKVLQKISNNRKIKEETKGQDQSEKKGK
ncbi:hypothetical protein GBA52_020102, partial [Prunus armeniaca]